MPVMFWPAVSLVYDFELIPHSKDTVTLLAVPSQVRSPLSRADLVSTLLGSLVVTNGDGGNVVKVFSSP